LELLAALFGTVVNATHVDECFSRLLDRSVGSGELRLRFPAAVGGSARFEAAGGNVALGVAGLSRDLSVRMIRPTCDQDRDEARYPGPERPPSRATAQNQRKRRLARRDAFDERTFGALGNVEIAREIRCTIACQLELAKGRTELVLRLFDGVRPGSQLDPRLLETVLRLATRLLGDR